MKKWILLIGLIVASACAHPPTVLSPTGKAQWKATRVIKGLDLVRDTAIDAEAQGLLKTDTTRKVVLWHQGAVRVIQAAGTGWQAAVRQSTQELLQTLTPEERQQLNVYVTLVMSLLAEVQVTQDDPMTPFMTAVGAALRVPMTWDGTTLRMAHLTGGTR